MNIFALGGHKVKVTEESALNGTPYDVANVKKHLRIGTVYTVHYTSVWPSSTDVVLREFPFPGMTFNSVNFEDVDEQPKEWDRLHRDWKQYCGDS